jgi:alpha-D-xyloside xylohydrolase
LSIEKETPLPLQPFFHEYDPAQRVIDIHTLENGVRATMHTRNDRTQPLEIHFLERGTVRVIMGDASQGSHVPDVNTLVAEAVKLERSERFVRIEGAESRAILRLDPFDLRIERLDGTPLWMSSQDDMDQKGRLRVMPLGFAEERTIGFQSQVVSRLSTSASFEIDPQEHFYGLGEKFTKLDKYGLTITSANSNAGGATSELAYKNVPFVLSSKGYGVFFNTTCHLRHDIANPTLSILSYVISVDSPVLEFYVLNGPDPKRVLHTYSCLTGFASVPPLWSFGLWLSRFYFEKRSTLEEVAHKARELNIPADVINTDTYWMRGEYLSDMQWDLERFPDPKSMISGLQEIGFNVCLWEYPYLSLESPLYPEAMARGYLCKLPNGLPATSQTTLPIPTHDRPGFRGVGTTGHIFNQRLVTPGALIDFTNPEAVTWWQDLHRQRLEEGVAVFKCDFGEDVHPDAQFHNGLTGREMHNAYPLYYQKAVYDVTQEVRGTGMIWGRSGWAGGQRYPVHWGGDPVCTFSAMAGTLRAALSYGLSGVPFWSHDIGGFAGTPSEKVFIRWAQFGLLSSHARTHGTTPREPWEFGEQALETFRRYTRLRYQLMPYIHHAATEAAEKAWPLMRAMFLEFPNDPTTFTLDTQYMFGSDLLIAPVMNEQSHVEVYLPAGRWHNYWKQEIIEGPTWIRKTVPLEEIPIYVRDGAVIPTVREAQHTGAIDWNELTLEMFGHGASNLHLPNGDTVKLEFSPSGVTLNGTARVYVLKPRTIQWSEEILKTQDVLLNTQDQLVKYAHPGGTRQLAFNAD